MYRSLLVPLDGSLPSEHALPLALSIARRSGAALQLVHVHMPLMVDGIAATYSLGDTANRAQAHSYLEALVKRLTNTTEVPVSGVLLDGPVVSVLEEHARTTESDLIVMTTHGRGPLSRFWLGSVADELIRRTDMPLLVVRPDDGAPDLIRTPVLQRILIPLDGSETAEQILEPAIALGTLMDAEYTLLRVLEPVPIYGHNLTGYAAGGTDLAVLKQLQAEAQTYLEGVAHRFRGRSRVQTRVVVHPQIASAILGEARAHAVNLIALETHGRHGLARLVLGSVADKVIRGAPIPILVHRTTKKTGGIS
jgi:nucleotide-binding universal stress UspA family protein